MNFFEGETKPISPLDALNGTAALSLDQLRSVLIRLEDTIIFNLIERAQFARNAAIYDENAPEFRQLNFKGSFVQYLLREMECVYARVRRYTSPDEHPFTPRHALPEPILPTLAYPQVLHPNDININDDIYRIYVQHVIPTLCNSVNDQQYGSAGTRDVECLQALSRRIHFGKFIAEAKFQDPNEHADYVRMIKAKDSQGIMERLTNSKVEEQVLARLRKKALTYGQDLNDVPSNEPQRPGTPLRGIHLADVVVDLYKEYVIPLTKEVEVDYLLKRLD